MQVSNLPHKGLKTKIIKMLTKLRKGMDEHSEIFDKEIEGIRKYQTEVTELVVGGWYELGDWD